MSGTRRGEARGRNCAYSWLLMLEPANTKHGRPRLRRQCLHMCAGMHVCMSMCVRVRLRRACCCTHWRAQPARAFASENCVHACNPSQPPESESSAYRSARNGRKEWVGGGGGEQRHDARRGLVLHVLRELLRREICALLQRSDVSKRHEPISVGNGAKPH